MNIKDITLLLTGLLSALIITYFLVIRKFNRFINAEIEKNEVYRINAEEDFEKASLKTSNLSESGDLNDNE